jgi:predicted outer membrane protein
MMKLMTAAATALLTAVGAAAGNQATERGADPSQQAAPPDSTAMQAETRVLNLMRLSNRAEVRAAEIVLERTQSDSVRRFADRLLRDHRLSDEMLSSLAESKGIALVPASFDGSPLPPTGPAAPAREELDSAEGAANPRDFGRQTAAGWDLPQIIEPPSARHARSQEPAPAETEQAEGPGQQAQRTPAPEPDQADAPGETARQPREPTAPEDPPPAADDQAAERPLDLDIARIKAERMLRELESADDASLDAVYAATMIKSHDETVQKLRTGVQSVIDAEVQDLVETFIPILEQHARLARHMQRELGGEAVAGIDQERR